MITVLIITGLLAFVVLPFFWPDPKCPHCGERASLEATTPKIPGHRVCMKCHLRWDSWNQHYTDL